MSEKLKTPSDLVQASNGMCQAALLVGSPHMMNWEALVRSDLEKFAQLEDMNVSDRMHAAMKNAVMQYDSAAAAMPHILSGICMGIQQGWIKFDLDTFKEVMEPENEL